jgi:NADH-quinone oxidoreductase subunit N
MTHPYEHQLADLFAFLHPEMALVFCACVLFIGGLFRSDRNLWGGVALGGIAAAFLLHLMSPAAPKVADNFGVPLLFDSLALLTRVLALATGVVFLLLAWHEMPEGQAADHHACLLVIIAGVSLVGASNDLVTLFLALEMISIPTYVLLYLPRHDDASQEASIKYFLLSIFSSGLTLFGFSYLFGLTGTTNIAGILQVLYGANAEQGKEISGLAQIAMLTIAAGLGFRITAVPFHFYAPDVFQGTSTSGAAFLSYIPKVAGFVAIVRVFGFIVPAEVSMGDHRPLVGIALSEQAPTLFWFLAALTMTVGNFLALLQDNLKRLLAYSSIAHAGYMLVALASASYLSGPDMPTSGIAALLFYLIAYGTMTFGIFAVILMLNRPERPVENVDDLAGLAKSHPRIALMVAVLLLSFMGFPLTAGFTGKFQIFFGAMSVQSPNAAWLYPTLALIGMLNAAIGAWYYLRIISVMYLRDSVKPIETRGPMTGLAALAICAVLTVVLSVPPGSSWILGAVRHTTQRPEKAAINAVNGIAP